MKKHIIWMLIGCIFPLLIIFSAPALGLSNNISLLIVVVAMFACHLMIPMHRHSGHKSKSDNKHSGTSKTEIHESHPH